MTLRRTTPFALAAGLLAAVLPAARGGDIGAVGSGNWSSTATRTGGAVPGSGDDVFIGGSHPAGAAQSVVVTLTGDAAARNLYLGYNNNGQGALDLGDSRLTLNSLIIGAGAGTTGTISRGTGSFTTNGLIVSNGNSLTLGSGDITRDLTLNGGSTATTSAVGNIASSVNVGSGSTLSLGSDLALSWKIGGQGTIDANGHDITAQGLDFTGAGAKLLDNGAVTVQGLLLNGAKIGMNALGDTTGALQLLNSSVLTLSQTLGDSTGFTLLGNQANSLQIDGTSVLALMFADTQGESWLFRWRGSWVGQIDSLIAAGRITVDSSWGYDVVEREGYTYIMQTSAAVPEPASVVMMGLGVAVGVGVFARRRKVTPTA